MIAIFKRRDGWTLEKEIPGKSPQPVYLMPLFWSKTSVALLTEQKGDYLPSTTSRIQFELVDFYKDSAGKYIKVFYEEI